jgi:hypothetical protein
VVEVRSSGRNGGRSLSNRGACCCGQRIACRKQCRSEGSSRGRHPRDLVSRLCHGETWSSCAAPKACACAKARGACTWTCRLRSEICGRRLSYRYSISCAAEDAFMWPGWECHRRRATDASVWRPLGEFGAVAHESGITGIRRLS